jgi:hypothetical protein
MLPSALILANRPVAPARLAVDGSGPLYGMVWPIFILYHGRRDHISFAADASATKAIATKNATDANQCFLMSILQR